MRAWVAKWMWRAAYLMLGAAGLIVAIGLMVGDPPPAPRPPTAAELATQAAQAEEDKLLSARGACRTALEQTLNDPGSAEWFPGYEWTVTRIDAEVIEVEPRLRAKNAFGALMLSRFWCRVREEGDNWRLIQLDQIEP